MKKINGVIAVVLVLSLLFAFCACSKKEYNEQKVTVAVTDENGEVVTDDNGDAVTKEAQAEVVTGEDGKAVTEIVTNKQGENVTDNSGNNVTQVVTVASATSSGTTSSGTTASSSTTKATGTTTATTDSQANSTTKASTTKKPSKPSAISELKSSNVTTDSVKLTWSKVKCDGYQLQQYKNDTWQTIKNTTDTSFVVKNLTSYTKYKFRVCAYNKNSAGTAKSAYKSASVKTKALNENRKITINVQLPRNASVSDKLQLYVNDELVKTDTVTFDGSTYSFTTKDKYKGVVKVKAVLSGQEVSDSVSTDKSSVTINLANQFIEIIPGDDD